MTNRPYIAYSLASATWIATGTTVEEARALARRSAGTDDLVVVFDVGDDAADITSEMQAHRLQLNLKGRPVVWRGANALAQSAFAQEDQAMTAKTAIEYTYSGPTGSSRLHTQGPFYFHDDGRDPVLQAKERCAKYGDTVESARRVDVSGWKSTQMISR